MKVKAEGAVVLAPNLPHDLGHRPTVQLLVRDDLEGDPVLQKGHAVSKTKVKGSTETE
jgi:hypothetical protein